VGYAGVAAGVTLARVVCSVDRDRAEETQ
jgi:hypothetical protein